MLTSTSSITSWAISGVDECPIDFLAITNLICNTVALVALSYLGVKAAGHRPPEKKE